MFQVPGDGKRKARRLRRAFSAGAVALTVSGSTPSPLSGPLLVMAALMGALGWKAADLAKDPPRADWAEPTVASQRVLRLERLRSLEPELAATVESLTEVEATMGAGLVGLERAQGAELAARPEVAIERYEEAMSFLNECAHSLSRAADLIGGPPGESSTYSRRVRVVRRPYPEEGIAFAIAAGLTETEIRPYTDRQLRIVALSGRLDATAGTMRDFAEWLSSWADSP